MTEDRKADRFVLRPDPSGWTVFEVWTGKPAEIAGAPQRGLSDVDADHMVKLLNRRARGSDRSMRS